MKHGYQALLDALSSHGTKVKSKVAQDVKCPAHHDSTASLSIAEGDKRAVAYCHAGCTEEAVWSALGISKAQLFHQDRPQGDELGEAISTYPYHDAEGNLVYRIARYVPKGFRPQREVSPGEWRNGYNGIPRVLYRLPEVIEAVKDDRWVFLVEGEKDVDRLRSLDLVATTAPNGAKSWDKTDTSVLAGAKVVAIRDNDDAGRKWLSIVLDDVQRTAAEVKVVDLPDIKAGGDVSDWLNNGGTRDTLITMARTAPEPSPAPVITAPPPEPATKERRYVDRDGLQALQLREAVCDQLILARGLGRTLWRFREGAWQLDGDDAVEAAVAGLMGDQYRPSYANNVKQALLADPPRTIDDTPIPEFINFRNGMLNWETGELIPHDPDFPTVNQIPHNWNPDAKAPRFEAFLKEVFHDDAAHLGLELIGYALYDGNPFQTAVLLLGTGANGKSVFFGVIGNALGMGNVSSIPLHVLADNRFAASHLYGKLANIAGDLASAYVQDSSQFKAVTGGDIVYADRKNRDAFQFVPRAFPLFSANEIPGSNDASHGYLRRWTVAEFPNTFTPDQEPGLMDTLESEADGILVLAVGALRTIMERGHLSQPESSKRAFEDFVKHIDPVRTFVEECIDLTALEARATRKDIYDAYRTWCRDNGHKSKANRKFYDRFRSLLQEAGSQAEEIKSHGTRVFDGLALTVTINRSDSRWIEIEPDGGTGTAGALPPIPFRDITRGKVGIAAPSAPSAPEVDDSNAKSAPSSVQEWRGKVERADINGSLLEWKVRGRVERSDLRSMFLGDTFHEGDAVVITQDGDQFVARVIRHQGANT